VKGDGVPRDLKKQNKAIDLGQKKGGGENWAAARNCEFAGETSLIVDWGPRKGGSPT